MFIAIQTSNSRRITSIAPEWRGREEELRRLARDGSAVCPGCQQLLWFRFNEDIEYGKRPHFAHRHKVDCPLPQQSTEVLEAKAQLYEWLVYKYPGAVDLDEPMKLDGWDRPADVVVWQTGQVIFAYWVFDRAVRNRHGLCCPVNTIDFSINILHTEKAHERIEQFDENCLALTASQRALAQINFSSRFNHAFGRQPHLHYLDTSTGELKIYRGLSLVHEPNLFEWVALRTGQLTEAKVCPKSGEPVFEADVADFRQWKQKDQERKTLEEEQKRAADARRKALEKMQRERPLNQPVAQIFHGAQDTDNSCEKNDTWKRFIGPFRCTQCGEMTTSWATAKPDEGTCLCRTCSQTIGKG